TREMSKLGGIRNVSPQFTSFFMIILLGSVALPLTSGFVGEFLLINGIYRFSMWAAVFAGLTVILGAVYMLRSFQAIMLGEVRGVTATFAALTRNEFTVLFVIAAAILFFGVYPQPILGLIDNDVKLLLEGIASSQKTITP
ncbi:MAG TPA: proton-conducting transporter membrane subunit, partial [Bacteroidia bacterium]|nr:proton-conducting transporter membrane subunit [Bacteroidia bacterium]